MKRSPPLGLDGVLLPPGVKEKSDVCCNRPAERDDLESECPRCDDLEGVTYGVFEGVRCVRLPKRRGGVLGVLFARDAMVRE